MKLSPQTWARPRPQRYPLTFEQVELPKTPSPKERQEPKDYTGRCLECPFEHEGCDYWMTSVPSAATEERR